ncbi:MAG: hypothetical protein II779_10110 [Clostridia bacterium]|nr:hypothetical protein [Clostridia bacterium]
MHCVPESKNARAAGRIVAALLIAGGIFYAVPIVSRAAGIRVFAPLFTALTFACVIAAVFLLVRYRMTSFQYIVRPRAEAEDSGLLTAYASGAKLNLADLPPETLDFVVIRSQGARPGAMECVLGMDDLIEVTPIRRAKKDGTTRSEIGKKYRPGGDYVSYDYTVTLAPDDALALVFRDGPKTVGIFIEPDEKMKAYFMGFGKGKRS